MRKQKLFLIFCSLSLALFSCGISNGNTNSRKTNNGNETNNGNNKPDGSTSNLKKVRVPLGGNAYLTKGNRKQGITTQGITKWMTPSNIYSVFVESIQQDSVKLFLRAKVLSGKSKIQLKVGNDFTKEFTLYDTYFRQILVGKVQLKEGYNQFNITGLSKTGAKVAQITDLILKVPKSDSLIFIRNNKNNRFYWGRRSPSVHLSYNLPDQKDIEWFYSEVIVPKGEDPVGSYFMADGFSLGYFGIQVNSKTRRTVLFSVWSPYNTDNPNKVPDSLRVKLLRKGKGVHADKFGNEGSGGQSSWGYYWEPGVTYKFLVHVKPKNNSKKTVCTAYFYAPERGKWKLIASWLRPQTHTWYTGAYSFVEDFSPANGYKSRKAYFGNQWVRDKNGNWYEITKAKFTGPSKGWPRHDFKGGTLKGQFYLMNGGFLDSNMPWVTTLVRPSSGVHPKINFNRLYKLPIK